MFICAICGKEIRPGDTLCAHTELEIARYQRDGCACGEDHDAEVTLTTCEHRNPRECADYGCDGFATPPAATEADQ